MWFYWDFKAFIFLILYLFLHCLHMFISLCLSVSFCLLEIMVVFESTNGVQMSGGTNL